MDHVLNSLESHYENYFGQFLEYHLTGDYKKLSENPMYDEFKAIIKAMNCLRGYLELEKISLKEEVECYIREWVD